MADHGWHRSPRSDAIDFAARRAERCEISLRSVGLLDAIKCVAVRSKPEVEHINRAVPSNYCVEKPGPIVHRQIADTKPLTSHVPVLEPSMNEVLGPAQQRFVNRVLVENLKFAPIPSVETGPAGSGDSDLHWTGDIYLADHE